MIASVDRTRDFKVFMNSEEIKKLSKKRIEGKLIETRRPSQQGSISILIDNTVSTFAHNGIMVIDRSYSLKGTGKVKLLLNNWAYHELVQKGRIGVRYGGLGSKVKIYNRERIDGTDAAFAEHLEFYRDNRERLIDDYSHI